MTWVWEGLSDVVRVGLGCGWGLSRWVGKRWDLSDEVGLGCDRWVCLSTVGTGLGYAQALVPTASETLKPILYMVSCT